MKSPPKTYEVVNTSLESGTKWELYMHAKVCIAYYTEMSINGYSQIVYV